MIRLDSVIKVNKKYHQQIHFAECKYEIKNNKTENLINDDFDTSISDKSDKKSHNESDSDESNY